MFKKNIKSFLIVHEDEKLVIRRLEDELMELKKMVDNLVKLNADLLKIINQNISARLPAKNLATSQDVLVETGEKK